MEAFVIHNGKRRKSRGFSCKEIVEAGLSCEDTCALNVRWDALRRSSYKENVEALKKAKTGMPAKAKPASKPAAPKAAKAQ
ncbi:hypothetical protein C4580_02660 [Candidatus Woesearchaeota archaeon]|nr:MAG: hypothetical protein C4580_02660 [Candidatus Woesearchaeota archaeon]